jgi:regulator of sigma E protease
MDLSSLAGLFWLVIILGISIFVHELGHYWAAKWQGVQVKNFAIFLGPTLLKFDRFGTTWRLNSIPLGGYAEIDGMQPEDTHGYAALPAWRKLIILVGGVVMNLLLAWVLVATLASVRGIPTPTTPPQVQISSVLAGSLAEKSGFKSGDVALKLNGVALSNPDDFRKFRDTEGPKTILVQRGEQTVELKFTWDNYGIQKLFCRLF